MLEKTTRLFKHF